MANAVRVRLDLLVLDALGREMLEESVEPLNRERDPARARLLRVRLDEERGVLVDVPQHLIPDAHVRGSAEEPRVPVDADLKIGYRDTGDKLGDRAHFGGWYSTAAVTWVGVQGALAYPVPAMADYELIRTQGDRRRYSLDGLGTLRLEGFFSRAATAEADGTKWHIAHNGFWRRRLEATDARGATVGRFEPRNIHRGGTLRWADREFTLRPASSWRERYALADGERELAILDGKGWGRRPVKVTVDDLDAIEPGLVLFAAFIVRGRAEDAQSAAGAGASTASMGGAG